MNIASSKKEKGGLMRLLPDKSVLAHVIWSIINSTQIGLMVYILFLTLEEAFQIALASRLVFFYESDDDYLYRKDNVQQASLLLITTGSITGILLINLGSLWYLYTVIKKSNAKEQTLSTLVQILFKSQSVVIIMFGTFIGYAITATLVFTIYFMVFSNAYSKQQQIIQIVLITILFILVLIYTFIHDKLINLKFINKKLICSRPQTEQFSYYKHIFYAIQIALSIKPDQNFMERCIFISVICVLSIAQLISATLRSYYFNTNLEFVSLLLKTLKSSYFVSAALKIIINFSYKEYFVIQSIIAPIMFGAIYIFYTYNKERTFNSYLIEGTDKHMKKDILSIKNSRSKLVQQLYQVLEYLDSSDSITNQKFLSLIMINEERVNDESHSFYDSITKIVKYKQEFAQDERKKDLRRLLDDDDANPPQNEEIQIDVPESFMESSANIQRDGHSSFGGGGGAYQYERRYRIEGINNCLADIFQNELIYKRNMLANNLKEGNSVIQMHNLNVDLNHLNKGIKDIKIKFMLDIIVEKALMKFPNSLEIMFLKAYITMDLLHNKYLTLTTITHIHSMMQRKSYFLQLESLISEHYFLSQSINSKQNTGSFSDQEINSDLLLEQSLKVDEILNYIKLCSQKISTFWQIFNSDSITRQHIQNLFQTTTEISEMLRHIKNYLKTFESVDNFQSSCQTLYFYLSHFFAMVLRDGVQAQNILRYMTNMRSLGQGNLKLSQVDETGAVVVDGNFDLYGRILFANKIIVKILGYKTDDLKGKQIHQLMPQSIADVHNKFWVNFSQIGVPKVLDQVRFLFVKDSSGFIAPYKIFIKFQYSYKFGFSFVGLFKKPKEIIFDDQEQPVKIKKTYQMICNRQGKILELSSSCNQLFKLNPQLLEKLHANIHDNFCLNIFNPQLSIPNMDFSTNTCMYFKYLNLNFSQIANVTRDIEVYLEHEDEEPKKNPFSALKTHYRCQMKIIKEDYGSYQSARVTLYYVIFAEMDDINASINYGRVPTTRRTISLSLPDDKSEDGESNVFFGESSAVAPSQSQTDSLMNPGSMSSSYSSGTESDADIKFIEEGIDYDKTPRPIAILKIAATALFLMIFALTSVQFGINNMYRDHNITYQKILLQIVQNQEYISQLVLLSRTYLNINLGVEPNNSTYFQDRKYNIQTVGFQLIEEIRTNLKDLEQFITMKNNYIDIQEIKNMTIYNLNNNKTVEIRQLSNFYSLSLWLVYVYEIFDDNKFNSTIGSYLSNSQKLVTHSDQKVFYVHINAEQDLKKKFQYFIESTNSFIQSDSTQSIDVNRYYVIASSIVILILVMTSIYFLVFVMQFKNQVLSFFTEMDKESAIHSGKSAQFFFNFIVSDDYDQLKTHTQTAEEYYNNKQKNQVVELIKKRTMDTKGKKSKSDVVAKKFLSQIKLRRKLRTKENEEIKEEAAEEEESIDEETFEKKNLGQNLQKMTQIFGVKNKNKENDQSLNMTNKQLMKKNKTQQLKSLDEFSSISDNEQEKAEQKHMHESGFRQKNKHILIKLNELKIRRTTHLVIGGIVVSFILMIYFLTQFLLFENSQTTIYTDQQQLQSLIGSMECSDEVIYQVRDIIVSNLTAYNLKLGLSKPISMIEKPTYSSELNETYQQCINQNSYVNSLLQTLNGGQWFWDDRKNETVCSYLESTQSNFNITSCLSIYKGILSRSVLQATQLFLQDSLSKAFTFEQNKQRNGSLIQQTLTNTIDLIDAHSFYLWRGTREYYQDIVNFTLSGTDAYQIVLSLFILFVGIIGGCMAFVFCYLLIKMRVAFWSDFYILKLLPKDELDKEFIKKINDFLRKA